MRHWTPGHHEIILASAIIALTPPAWQKSGWHTEYEALRHIRLAVRSPRRIIVIEKALEDRVEIIEAKTRTPGSPYYRIIPSGRVPYLIDDSGVGMEDSQLICAYLDSLDGKPRFHNASQHPIGRIFGLSFRRQHVRRHRRMGPGNSPPENECSPTTLPHEAARAQRMADFFDHRDTIR